MFLGYLELFHKDLHGFDEFSDPNIHQHFITILSVKNPIKYLSFLREISTMSKEDYYDYICHHSNAEITYHRIIIFHIMNHIKKMPFLSTHPIRNFLTVQDVLYEPQIHLFDKIDLDTGESICILKTFWLKCIQRKWKKICQYNKKMIAIMTSLKSIKNREINIYNKRLLGLKGMWYSTINDP